jgi:NAD(P)-dependent dehydrogenase (short-subunit alcohol dehydrogenase family)
MPVAELSSTPLADLVSLAGRTAVVTGGARGIGRAICRRLAEAGAFVFIGDRDKDAAADAAREIGNCALGASLDVTDSVSQNMLAARAVAETGRLDIWVNCAGIFPSQSALELTDADWRRVLETNLDGTFYGCRAAAQQMTGGGVILNIASTAGIRPAGPGYAHYASSKAGVIALTQSLAREWGPNGIRVLALAPSFVHTPGTDAQIQAFQAATGRGGAEIGAALPLGRAGQPDDIARVALFCVSDLALYMTGVTLPVDGGRLVS